MYPAYKPELSLGLKSEFPLVADWKFEKSAKDSWVPDGSARSNRLALFAVVDDFCSEKAILTGMK